MLKEMKIPQIDTVPGDIGMPLSSTSAIPGQTLHSISAGEGSPTILVHGLAASLHDWEVLLPELASYSYQAFAVDLFGHGDSPKPELPELYTISTVIETFEAWIEKLVLDSPLMLVGHSLGGHVCLQYSLRHPERIKCMVLIDPFFRPTQLSPVLRLFNKRPRVGVKALQTVPLSLIDTVLGWDPVNAAQYSPQARWRIAYYCKRASPNILNIPSTIPDLTADLHRIDIPCLIIWGSKDFTLKPDTFNDLVAQLPKAAGHEINDCGHHPHIRKPVLVNRIILDFLNSHRQQSLPAASDQ